MQAIRDAIDKMMRYRGYTSTGDETPALMDNVDVGMYITFRNNRDASDLVLVFNYDRPGNAGVGVLKELRTALEDVGVNRGILVAENLTSDVQKQTRMTSVGRMTPEDVEALPDVPVMHIESLTHVDVSLPIEHDLQPIFQKMNDDEIDDLFTRFSIIPNSEDRLQRPEHRIARMPLNDPVARYMGYREMDIIRIIRKRDGFTKFRIVLRFT